MKVVYLITNSETLINAYNPINKNNVKNQILSCTGEVKANKLSYLKELQSLDSIYSSSYVSSLSTAKYIARNNNIKINIEENFDEREIGEIKRITPKELEYHSLTDFDYKLSYGESINDVKKRTSKALKQILNQAGTKFAIITHKTAILSLLLNWCTLGFNYDNEPILSYNEEVIHDGTWEFPEIFELTFNEEKNITSIKNITI